MNDIDLSYKISRNLVEDLCKDKLDALVAHIQAAISTSGASIDSVEIIGGGSRLPLLRNKIKTSLNCELRSSLDSSHCIATGAALLVRVTATC